MKTKINAGQRAVWGLGLAVVLALGAIPSQTQAQPLKGGERMTTFNEITTRAQAESLQAGDAIAMACAKCKSIMVHNVTTDKGHIKTMTVGEKHLCPGCSGKIEVKGMGKGAQEQVTHVCSKCGDNSVFCCATKGTAAPTKGMQQ